MTLSSLLLLALLPLPTVAATPAATAIQQALATIAKQPAHYPYYNDLAAAYARRARETADARFYTRAEDAMRQSLALAPGNFEALKMQVVLQLSRGEFSPALAAAAALNRQVPDDLAVYGYLVDANLALGNYQDAVDAAQWMLNLRPGNVPALLQASRLRQLYGNLPGALELLQSALAATSPADADTLASILTRTAHLHLLGGDLSQAENSAQAALIAFPDYPCALTALAQVRIAQRRYPEAVRLFERRYQAAPCPRTLYALAEARQLAGLAAEARLSFQQFEALANAESASAHNSNRQLIAYYTDHAANPARALALARREIALRHDVFTLDSYAWALAANRQYQEADRQLQMALALGVRDPQLCYHAGFIALHLQLPARAAEYLKDAAARHSRQAAALLAALPR